MADRMCFDCGAIFAEGGPLTAPNGGHTAGCYSDDPDVREVASGTEPWELGSHGHMWPCGLFYDGNWDGDRPRVRCTGIAGCPSLAGQDAQIAEDAPWLAEFSRLAREGEATDG